MLLSKELISINGKLIPYGSKPESIQHTIFRTESVILRNNKECVLFPGEFIEVRSEQLGDYENAEVSIELRVDSPSLGSWPSPGYPRLCAHPKPIFSTGQD